MPRGGASAHRPPAPPFWKSWCPLVSWSGKGQRKPSPFCPPPGHGAYHGAAGTVTVPALTAEWEHRLKEVERGTLAPGDFMDEIAAMLRELVETCRPVEGGAVLFPSTCEAVGRLPPVRRDRHRGQEGLFLRKPGLRLRYLEGQQVVGEQKEKAHQVHRCRAAEGRRAQVSRPVVGKDGKDLCGHGAAHGRRDAGQLPAGVRP